MRNAWVIPAGLLILGLSMLFTSAILSDAGSLSGLGALALLAGLITMKRYLSVRERIARLKRIRAEMDDEA